jgi:hypothetical protein
MIIVSEPSAEATQPVRTVRYTPACRRSSAALNDIPRDADAVPISVHTEDVKQSEIGYLGLGQALPQDNLAHVSVLGARSFLMLPAP